MAEELALVPGVSVICVFPVDFFSPAGIALAGLWDESKGVIMPDAKDHAGAIGLEIDVVKIATQMYDS